MTTTHTNIFDLTDTELADVVTQAGQPAYRARQILDWLYAKGVRRWDDLSNVPKALRQYLAERYTPGCWAVADQQVSRDGTTKLLLTDTEGRSVETVGIPMGDRATACVSTQVGCPVGCAFCASGLTGLEANISSGAIVEQVLLLRHQADMPIGNVVFMGMGEPLANYNATIAAVRALNAPWGCGIAVRRITVSTVGLPGRMRRLADEGLQITLAVSLHAPNDALRTKLIPWAKDIPLDDIIDAAGYYFDRTGREITIEYILLAGVNTHDEHARELANVCRRIRCNVNLIAYNTVEQLPFSSPTAEHTERFRKRLADLGVNVHLRASKGRDLEAACGQLRRRHCTEQTGPA